MKRVSMTKTPIANDMNMMSIPDTAYTIKYKSFALPYPTDNFTSWLVEKAHLYIVLTDQWTEVETTTQRVFLKTSSSIAKTHRAYLATHSDLSKTLHCTSECSLFWDLIWYPSLLFWMVHRRINFKQLAAEAANLFSQWHEKEQNKCHWESLQLQQNLKIY